MAKRTINLYKHISISQIVKETMVGLSTEYRIENLVTIELSDLKQSPGIETTRKKQLLLERSLYLESPTHTLPYPRKPAAFCLLTTSPSTRVRTLSPISGEMSLPNCCRVVRNRFSLLSCRAPQAGGSCWLAREEEEEEEGPLLKPLGGEGAPFKAVGEWLVPLVTVKSTKSERKNKLTEKCTRKLQPSLLPFKSGGFCNFKTVEPFL